MSHNDEVESLARELLSAYETGAMVAIPPSGRPGFDLNTAYEVEATLKRFREAGGHRAVGRKVGYANKAMWRVLKLETLVWAHMYDDTVHYSDRNSATLTIAHPRSLKIEPEIVFGLKQPIVTEGAAAPDAAAALASTDWLAVGFEIIDCPFPEWQFQPSDFVASFGLHAALVIGERVQVRPDSIAALLDELPRFKVRMSCSKIEERRVCGRRIRQELLEEPRLVPRGTQRSHRAAVPNRAVERGGNRQFRNAHVRTSNRQRRSLDS